MKAAAAKTAARQRVSVADVLKREGIFTQAELDRLEYLLERGQRLEVAMKKAGKPPKTWWMSWVD